MARSAVSLLAPEIRAELRSLPPLTAERVAGHLVNAGRLLEESPEDAYREARAARSLAPRVAAVREALGLCAYATGRYAEALSEFRTYRRLTGSPEYLPAMADCERGLGRPERALEVANDPDVSRLSPAMAAELRIVLAGARLDLGQPEAALLVLRGPDLDVRRRDPWSSRLFYAYARALEAAGRDAEAAEWVAAASRLDPDVASGTASSAHDSAAAENEEIDAPVVVHDLEELPTVGRDQAQKPAGASGAKSRASRGRGSRIGVQNRPTRRKGVRGR